MDRYKSAQKQGKKVKEAIVIARSKDAEPLGSPCPKNSQTAKSEPKSADKETTYFWSDEEHQTFILNFHTYGRSWKAIADNQPNRNALKCRTHGQKYLQGLKRFLDEIESVLEKKVDLTSEFCLKLLRYEIERQALLKRFPIGKDGVE